MNATALLALLTATIPLVAQQPSPGPVGRQNVNRPGPWDNDVLVYRVDSDGRSERLATFERAGVPTLARLKDGRLISAFQTGHRIIGPRIVAESCCYSRRTSDAVGVC